MRDFADNVVMIVDDVESNIDVLVETLGDEYKVRVAMDGESALEDIDNIDPDIILLDVMMPGIDGYEVCRKLKARDRTRNIPVVFLTARNDDHDEATGLQLGAVDYITKPFNPLLVKSRVRNHLLLKQHQDNLNDLVKNRTHELAITQEVTIESMGTLAEYRDPETGGHIRRTKNYIKILAEHLRKRSKFSGFLDDETIELLWKSAPLHDIGKVGVRDNVLLKPGRLTPEEFEEIKKHTIFGRDAIRVAESRLGKQSFLRYASPIACSHHEKWDGSGYPQGLKGNNIPIPARLMAVADVYDALISKRIYKPPFPHKKAVSIMNKGRGEHFDPDIIDVFLEQEEMFRKIAHKFADFEEERQALSAQ